MNDILEVIQDLRELQRLYKEGDICYLDFQEKINKYESIVDEYEANLDRQFAETGFYKVRDL